MYSRTAGSLLAFLLTIPITVQGAPVGSEFQVNTYTTSVQGYGGPTVAMDQDGSFVVVWVSVGSAGTDSDSVSVQGQRYSSDGNKLGAEFQVNTYTTSAQGYGGPAVAMDQDGDFVVAWASRGSAGTDSDRDSVQGQRYSSDGSRAGAEFQVNTYTTHDQGDYGPAIAMDQDGSFVVVWFSGGSAGTDSDNGSVQGQLYDSDGNPIGAEFQVNTYTTNTQGGEGAGPAVAMDQEGDFVVVWESFGSAGSDSSGLSVQGQRFASDGSAVGSEFQVNTYTTSYQGYPGTGVAMSANGDFVVVWNSRGQSEILPTIETVQAQRYASDGSTVGSEFQVSTYTTYSWRALAVSMDADGDFVVVWDSYNYSGSDSDGTSIQGRRYSSDGSAIDAEFQVNSYTTRSQGYYGVAVAMDADGDFVVVWDAVVLTGPDSDRPGVRGQRFDSRLPPLCDSTPATGCRSTVAGRSRFQIKDKDGSDRDQIKWKWNKGDATDLAHFADPIEGSARYSFCIYDDSTNDQPLMEATLLPGGMCSGDPCWKATGASGLKFKDRDGTPDGISGAKFKAGDAGKAQVQIRAKRDNLVAPAPPLMLNATVQLLIDDGVTTECWQTEFGSELANEAGKFKAKGP